MPDKKSRVLFADFAVLKYKTIVERLEAEGVESDAVTDGMDFLDKISTAHYEVGMINLLLGGIGPFELIRQIREKSLNRDIKIIVVSKQTNKINVQNVLQAGASDFVPDGIDNESIYYRLKYHLAPKTELAPEATEPPFTDAVSVQYLNLLLEACEVLSRADRTKSHEACVRVLGRIAALVKSNRTSLIMVDSESNTGVVLAASDDPGFRDFHISLIKYPEVAHVTTTGHPVSIPDVSQHALTKDIQKSVRTIQIGSIMVFPVYFQGEVVGVLNVRRKDSNDLPRKEVLRILQAVSTTMAAHSNVKARLRKIYKDFKPEAA